MNKKFIVLFFILVFMFQFISAAEIEVKSEVFKGENLIAKVSGIFTEPLTLENIAFYRRHLPTSMGFYEIFEIEGEYYIYAQIPLEKIADNYSIVIEDSTYKSGTKTISDNVVGNFSILDTEASFRIAPGILTASSNYSITLLNLGPSKITVEYGKKIVGTIESEDSSFWDSLFGKTDETIIIDDSTKYISLLSGEEKEILIEPESYFGFQEVEFRYENQSYHVLAYIEEEIVNESEEVVNISEEEVFEEIAQEEITGEVEEEPTFWDKLLGKDKVVEEEEIVNQTPEGDLQTCEEMGHVVCGDGEKCGGETTPGGNKLCCLTDCVVIPTTSTGKTIGWILIIIVAFIVTWFLKKKYQETKASPTKF